MLSVLIVDDSPTARDILVAILGSDPDIQIVGQAEHGRKAIELAKSLRPDVITMDINMPGVNGMEATKEIMIESPAPIVIISASTRVADVQWTMQALRAGALTVLKKPISPSAPDFDSLAKEIVHTVKAMAGVFVIRHHRGPALPVVNLSSPAHRLSEVPSTPPKVIAMAASTGGPPALSAILGALPAGFPVPVLVVQHIVPSFMDGFVRWLDGVVQLNVQIAKHDQRIEPGNVYVAPPEKHLGMSTATRLALSDQPKIDGFRPAATHLFRSVADHLGARASAVIMTGMGCDGVDGLRRVREMGGYTIAQNEETCIVFGMPQAAIEAGVVDQILPLGELATELQRIVTRK